MSIYSIYTNKDVNYTLIMNTTKNPNEKAFKFVKIFESPPKPRHLQDLLDMWGDYIDGFK